MITDGKLIFHFKIVVFVLVLRTIACSRENEGYCTKDGCDGNDTKGNIYTEGIG